LVNGLLTKTIKVNILAAAESQFDQGTRNEEADPRFLDLAARWRLGQRRFERLVDRARRFGGKNQGVTKRLRSSVGAFARPESSSFVAAVTAIPPCRRAFSGGRIGKTNRQEKWPIETR
jgi:hypothetical protein